MGEKEKEFYYKTTLIKDRGWTEYSIKKFLIKPDKVVPNPNNRKTMSSLYSISRVENIENTDDWKNWFIRKQKRSNNIKKAIDNNINNNKKYFLNSFKFFSDINNLNFIKLIKKAIKHYNDFKEECDYFFYKADINSDPEFLYRITKNYIRHNLTNYDHLCDKLFNKKGRDFIYQELRNLVDSEIDKIFPYLLTKIVNKEHIYRR